MILIEIKSKSQCTSVHRALSMGLIAGHKLCQRGESATLPRSISDRSEVHKPLAVASVGHLARRIGYFVAHPRIKSNNDCKMECAIDCKKLDVTYFKRETCVTRMRLFTKSETYRKPVSQFVAPEPSRTALV